MRQGCAGGFDSQQVIQVRSRPGGRPPDALVGRRLILALGHRMKKLFFWLFILFFVFAQSYFIYVLNQPEAAKSFTQIWYSCGGEQTAYSQFVFRTSQWCGVLASLGIGLGFSALFR